MNETNDLLYKQYDILHENLTKLIERFDKLEVKYELQHPTDLNNNIIGLGKELESFEKIYHETQKHVNENITKLQTLNDHYEELNGKFNIIKSRLERLEAEEKESKATSKHLKIEVFIIVIASLVVARYYVVIK